MKNIKTFIIGFLTATTLFLFMGFRPDAPSGTYQLVASDNGYFIFNTKVGLFAAYYADDTGQHIVKELDKIMSE